MLPAYYNTEIFVDVLLNREEGFIGSPKDLFYQQDAFPYHDNEFEAQQSFMLNVPCEPSPESAGTFISPFCFLLKLVYSLQVRMERELVSKESVLYFTHQFSMSFHLYSSTLAGSIEKIFPSSRFSIQSFEQQHGIKPEFQIKNVVDALSVTRYDIDISGVNLLEVSLRLEVPVPVNDLALYIEPFVNILLNYLKYTSPNTEQELVSDDRNRLVTFYNRLESFDVEEKRTQQYMRSVFIQQALARVSFVQDIKFFWINQGNTRESHSMFCTLLPDGQVSFKKIDVKRKMLPCMLNGGSYYLKDYKKKTAVKDMTTFRDGEQVWECIRSMYEYQLWSFSASLLMTSQKNIGMKAPKNTTNVFLVNPNDYEQIGFVNPFMTSIVDVHEHSSQSSTEKKLYQPSNIHMHDSWQRNKSFQTLSRCLLNQALEECRTQTSGMELFLSGDNYDHIIEKYSDACVNISIEHMSKRDSKEEIHYHPAIYYKQNLFNGFPLTISEPVWFGPMYTLSACTALFCISHQLFIVDRLRQCNNGSIMLCGESRSGKSMIKESVNKFFGGYEWRKTNGNFQSKTLLNASVVTVEEIELACLKDEKKGSCYWKKRLDQSGSCDIDLKCKDGKQCLRYVPFVMTTNENTWSIKKYIEPCFCERISTIQFTHSILGFQKKIEEYEHSQYKTSQWAEHFQSKTAWSQYAEIANLICLFYLLFPPPSTYERYYFIDDTVTEHLIKLLITGKHSAFLFMFFRLGGNKFLHKMMLAYKKQTSLSCDEPQTKKNTWLYSMREQIANNDEFIDFLSTWIKMGTNYELVFDTCLSAFMDTNATMAQLTLVAYKICLNIFHKQYKKTFVYYRDLEHLKTQVQTRTLDSNVKRHLLLNWDRIVKRFGLY